MREREREREIPFVVDTLGTVNEVLEKRHNWRENQDYTDHSIVKIGLNLQNSLGDLTRYAVNQTSVKDHQ